MSSFGFLGSLFTYYWGGKENKANPIEEEMKMLMDATVLSTPLLLRNGFDLFMRKNSDNDTVIGESISHLSELDLHTAYFTQKGTQVTRISQSEVVLGDNEAIFIPILKRGETYETTRNLSQLCMKGQLYPEVLFVAIENFSGMRIKDQGILFYENGNSRKVFAYEDFSNLEPEVTYIAPNGSIVLTPKENRRVEFSFGRNLCPLPLKEKKLNINPNQNNQNNQNHQNNQNNNNQNINRLPSRKRRRGAGRGLLHSLPSTPVQPTSPRIVTRRGVKKRTFQTMESSVDTSNLENTDSTQFQSPPEVKRLRPENNENNPKIKSPGSPDLKNDLPLVVLLPPPTPPVVPPAPPKPPGPPPPPPAKVMVPPPPPTSRTPLTPASQRRRLRPLHWKSIPRNKLPSTFWSNINNIDIELHTQPNLEGHVPEGTIEIPEDLFEKEVVVKFALSPEKKEENTKPALEKLVSKVIISILDVKRSNNIGILLSQFKMTFVNIKKSILELDDLLTNEHLISLKYMFPLSEEERMAFEEFTGDTDCLSGADLFYLEMLPIPRLEQKINFFFFKRQFHEQIEALRESATTLACASSELLNSVQFAKLLKWIFTIGSMLNRDTRFESAGFSLESLPKIVETKAGQGHHGETFIDFLVSCVEKKNPELLHFEDELVHLERASKLSIDILNSHKKETENEIFELRREIAFYESAPPGTFSKQDKFHEIMKPFLANAEQTFETVSNTVTTAITTFNSVVEYFGDDSKIATPGCFFKNIVVFAHSFRRAHHNILEKRRRVEATKAKELKRQESRRLVQSDIPQTKPHLPCDQSSITGVDKHQEKKVSTQTNPQKNIEPLDYSEDEGYKWTEQSDPEDDSEVEVHSSVSKSKTKVDWQDTMKVVED